MTPIRAAFVVEQTLGHVTHFHNLRESASRQAEIAPVWLPIPFDVLGATRMLPLLRSNWSVRASWRARRALEVAMAAGPLDAMVFHTQVTSLFARDFMRRIPTIVSLDATPINYDSVGAYYGHRPAADGFVDRQKYRLNRAALQAAARVVTWSEWARRSVIEDYAVDSERIHVLAPGAAEPFFEIGQARGAAQFQSGEDRKVRILFVGGDLKRKGGPALLECMRGPLGLRCELHLVTTADVGPTGPNVFVHREQANSPALLQLFREADIFALPTMAECLAIVLMEATAAGLPVITTDVGALAEAIRPGESGLLVRPGDAGDLNAVLTALVDDPQLRTRMGKVGHVLARGKFDSTRNNRVLFDLISEIARTPQGLRRAA